MYVLCSITSLYFARLAVIGLNKLVMSFEEQKSFNCLHPPFSSSALTQAFYLSTSFSATNIEPLWWVFLLNLHVKDTDCSRWYRHCFAWIFFEQEMELETKGDLRHHETRWWRWFGHVKLLFRGRELLEGGVSSPCPPPLITCTKRRVGKKPRMAGNSFNSCPLYSLL